MEATVENLKELAEEELRDWSGEAKGLLKAELKRRNMTYAHLVQALGRIGIKETEANLRNKISRGNFSAAFLLQVLDAIGCTFLQLSSSQVQTYTFTRKFPAATRALVAKRTAEIEGGEEES
ncbi:MULTISPECIES: DUF6471 domain-containing protein [Brevundimonas]|uniref:DUF6471 domain-containing protein n=1 Tax=Brevundimonas TaxID=41275 RepID=UPI0009DEFA9B|nr:MULTISPECIES: DUF6471 domain-containing protein [Brevundimonas]